MYTGSPKFKISTLNQFRSAVPLYKLYCHGKFERWSSCTLQYPPYRAFPSTKLSNVGLTLLVSLFLWNRGGLVNGFFALFVKMTAKQETPSEQLRRKCQIYSRESLTSSFDTESDGTIFFGVKTMLLQEFLSCFVVNIYYFDLY